MSEFSHLHFEKIHLQSEWTNQLPFSWNKSGNCCCFKLSLKTTEEEKEVTASLTAGGSTVVKVCSIIFQMLLQKILKKFNKFWKRSPFHVHFCVSVSRSQHDVHSSSGWGIMTDSYAKTMLGYWLQIK